MPHQFVSKICMQLPTQEEERGDESKKSCMSTTYLVVNIGSPESMNSTIVRIGRENGGSGGAPNIVNVLNNKEGLANGVVGVDENRDFLVDGIGLEKKLALTPKLLLNEGYLRPHHIRARR
jgi:hypothetical protein